MAIQIADDQGQQVRRIELTADALTPGVHRIAWDLRRDPPAGAAGGRGAQGGGGGGRRPRRQRRSDGRAGALHRDDRDAER